MPRNSFVQMSKLHNVRGRIYYISSDKKQEISMRYMKPQTENFGQNLPSAIRQNLRKAVQRENVSKQENLSLPCRNPLWIIRQTDY